MNQVNSVGGVEPIKLENQLLGETLTPEGWKEIRWRSGEETVVDPLDLIPFDAPIKPLHKKFRERHRSALNLFFSAINQMKEIERKVPALREELMDKLKLEKQVIKDLCEFGLLKQEIIPLELKEAKLGGRAVIIPTMEARKLMRSIERALLEVMDERRINGARDQDSEVPADSGTKQASTPTEVS